MGAFKNVQFYTKMRMHYGQIHNYPGAYGGKRKETGGGLSPRLQCRILRHLSAIRLVRDAKHLSRVCRLEGASKNGQWKSRGARPRTTSARSARIDRRFLDDRCPLPAVLVAF